MLELIPCFSIWTTTKEKKFITSSRRRRKRSVTLLASLFLILWVVNVFTSWQLLSMTPPEAPPLVVSCVARGGKDAREAILAFAKETGISLQVKPELFSPIGISALFLGARGLSATQSLLLGSVRFAALLPSFFFVTVFSRTQ
jgi:hypothetical protein